MNSLSDHTALLNQGQKIAWTATLAAFAMAVLKGAVGYLFQSPVLIADAFHSGSDIFINFAAGFGLLLATAKQSERFPYGLYRAETLACFVIAIFIIFTGTELFREGWYKLHHQSQMEGFPVFPIAAALISSLVSWIIARKMKRIGSSIGSHSLIANAKEAFLDVFVSLVVLAGILLSFLKIPLVEGSVIILISVLIVKVGIENLWISLLVLLDANVNPGLQGEIEDKINEIYGVKGVGEVKIRQSGPFKMVECVIETRPTISMYKAHELADRAERKICKECDGVESVFIHIEPAREDRVTALVPVTDVNGMDSPVSGKFARARCFAILLIGKERVDLEDFYLNEYLHERKHAGVKVVKAIVKYKVDYVFTSDIGEISFHYLKENFVDIYRASEGMTLEKVVEAYRMNRLLPLSEPLHMVEESATTSDTIPGNLLTY